jgi:hypothetical protein
VSTFVCFSLSPFLGAKMDGNQLAPLIARLYNALKNEPKEKQHLDDDDVIAVRQAEMYRNGQRVEC